MEKKKKRVQYEEYYDDQPYDDDGARRSSVLAWPLRLVKAPFRLCLWLLRGMWRWWWQAVGKAFVWSGVLLKQAWQLAMAVIRQSWSVLMWTLKSIWYLIVGAPMPDLPEFDEYGNPNVKLIRLRIKRRYQRRFRLVTHIVIFLIANIGIWLDFFEKINLYNTGYYSYPPSSSGHLMLTGIWAIFLILHFIRFKMTDAEEDAVEQEVERRRSGLSYAERRLRLSDDGELVYGGEEFEEKRKLQYGE